MKEIIESLKNLASFRFATYWHIEMLVAVPFIIWFVWATYKVIHLLEQIVTLLNYTAWGL